MINYYYAINKAKVLAVDSNYTEAFKTYNNAFNHHKAFCDDFVSAYSCAVSIKKYSAAKKYIYKGFRPPYTLL